ncbi:MAG: 2OG-Fe(II) oxygenase [Rudaea sp.]
MLDPQVVGKVEDLAARFRTAAPFRHVVIENFFEAQFCARLLDDFPPFERGNNRNEAGQVGGKSSVAKIRELGASWCALDDLIQTRGFLDLIGQITGIENLLYDPWYFGGGTHDNRAGQELDPHVDFNRHPVERWHRRLNLIVYLNREWDEAWGGCLELHSNPRATDDRVEMVAPAYNRAVIFETTETSWHGFNRIVLPVDKQSLSRKSVALYFYTTHRPQTELADTHSTIYVDRPLPDRFKPGLTLTDADVQQLRMLLARRDQHNQRLYRDTTDLTKQLEQAQAALHAGRLGRLRYFARRVLARLQR